MIAPLVVWRRGEDDFLLLTEPELGATVRDQLTRARIAVALRDRARGAHLGDRLRRRGRHGGIPTHDYGVPAVEVLDAGVEASPPDEELERLRILARTPRWGREIDDGILPAEAGLDERAVSFTKGCYPGQEPLARLRNRGHVNRTLRVLEVEGEPPGELLPQAAEVRFEESVVGRVTSAVPGLALAYVRVEVPDGAALEVDGRRARIH